MWPIFGSLILTLLTIFLLVSPSSSVNAISGEKVEEKFASQAIHTGIKCGTPCSVCGDPCGNNLPPPPPPPPPLPPPPPPPPPPPSKCPTTSCCNQAPPKPCCNGGAPSKPPPPPRFIYITGPPGHLYPADPSYYMNAYYSGSRAINDGLVAGLMISVFCAIVELFVFW